MSMIICEECGKEFSDKAPSCPNCGCPNQTIKTEVRKPVFKEDKKESKTVTQFQLDFTEEPKEDKLREYLDTIDPNYITPIEALNILDKLKKISKD